jgi:hypothetical protein
MSIKSENIQKLLQRKLSRKEFLQVVGLMLLSLVGVRAMLANVDQSFSPASGEKEKVYSEDSYGG